MAKTKLTVPLDGLRGTVGGVTYSANGSGTYAKGWVGPSKRNSTKQSTQRMYLGNMGQGWAGLSAAQRTDWNAFAALPAQALVDSLGQTYYASGYNWYTSCNTRLYRVGRSLVSDAPTQARPAAPAIDSNGLRIEPAGSDPNLCSGGTPSASSYTVGYPASNAFDGNLTTRWVSGQPFSASWLEYQFVGAREVQRYRIYSGTGTQTPNPGSWTFEYFDGATWQVAHTVTGQTFVASTWYEYNFANTVASTRWRLNISANQGYANYVHCYCLEMTAALYGRSCVMYPAGEFLDTPDYDIVVEVAQQNSQARASASSGYYEVLASKTPGSMFSDLQAGMDSAFGVVQAGKRWFARVYRQTQEGVRSAAAAVEANTWQ